MSHVLSLVNTFAASWADALVRACWQGGLVIALVWAVCRLWPALPPAPRCWLWRLAYAKLLLGLVWLPPLALLLLPIPAAPPPPPAQASVIQEQPASSPPAAADALPPEATAAAPRPLVPFPATPAIVAPRPLAAPPVMPTLQTLLLTAWLLGALASLTRVASACRRALALSRACTPIADDALRADAAELCRRLGLRRVPPLRVSGDIPSPLLLGLGKPTVLLPAFVLSGSPRAEVKLILAHELAHLARRDLLWDIVPHLAQRLFFFHPLVWLAGHEWALAQEIACDALAVQATGAPPSAYGRMLLGIATRRRSAPVSLFPTLAVGPPRHTLRRRLHAMQHIGTTSRLRLILAAALTTALAVVGLLPWRVVAQSGSSPLTRPVTAQGATLQQKVTAGEEEVEARFASEDALKNAKLDEQTADFIKRLVPEQQKEAQAEISRINTGYARNQQRIQMLKQQRSDYQAAHPSRLSDAQYSALSQLIGFDDQRNHISNDIAWRQVVRANLLSHLVQARDSASKQGYRSQIQVIDRQRRAAEREIRAQEPILSQQKTVAAAIPKDQREAVVKMRNYDLAIMIDVLFSLSAKQREVSVLRRRFAGKPSEQHQGTTIKASSAPSEAKTASFDAVAVGGPPPPRLAQSVALPPVPAAVAQSEAVWQEQERKQQADIDSRNAKLDAQLAEIQKHLSPAQLKTAQPWIASINADYAREQQRIQISEQSRAVYSVAHPNKLSDAQIAFVEQANWQKRDPSRINESIRWEQTIERKLQAHLASSHDLRFSQKLQRQIAAIDERRREGERQIRELGPVLARQDEQLAAIPKDQRDRVAKLRSYGFEISGGRITALTEKQAQVWVLGQRLAGKLKGPAQPSHASADPQRPRTFQVSVRVPRQRTHQVRVFTRDAMGRHLILDKLCQAGESLSHPATARGNKVGFLVYEDGKLVKDQSL